MTFVRLGVSLELCQKFPDEMNSLETASVWVPIRQAVRREHDKIVRPPVKGSPESFLPGTLSETFIKLGEMSNLGGDGISLR